MVGFYSDGASYVRVDDVEKIRPLRSQKGEVQRYAADLRSGGYLEMFEGTRDAFLRRPVQLLPAQPGISIMHTGKDADGIWERREPVIAWALCLDGEVRPMAAGGIFDDSRRTVYVEMPDGTIHGVTEWAEYTGFKDAAALRTHLFGKEQVDG